MPGDAEGGVSCRHFMLRLLSLISFNTCMKWGGASFCAASQHIFAAASLDSDSVVPPSDMALIDA